MAFRFYSGYSPPLPAGASRRPGACIRRQSLVNPRAGFAGLPPAIRRGKTQNTSARNPVTCRTVCAILESDLVANGCNRPAIGRVAE